MRILCAAAVVVLVSITAFVAVSPVAPAFAANAIGNWYTGDKESQVRIVNCAGALCGSDYAKRGLFIFGVQSHIFSISGSKTAAQRGVIVVDPGVDHVGTNLPLPGAKGQNY